MTIFAVSIIILKSRKAVSIEIKLMMCDPVPGAVFMNGVGQVVGLTFSINM